MSRKALLVIVGASLAQAAPAELRETAPGKYACEAAPGQESRVDVSDYFGPRATMAARIRYVGEDPAETQGSSAGLVFRLDDGNAATVSAFAPTDIPDRLFLMLTPPDNSGTYPFVSRRRASPVEVSATMARGAVFVRAGNERAQIYVEDRNLVGREIVCSSGRFEIELTRQPRSPRRLP